MFNPMKMFTKPVASPHPLDLEIQQRFLALDQGGMIQAEYIWIGGNNELRCKTKVGSPLFAHSPYGAAALQRGACRRDRRSTISFAYPRQGARLPGGPACLELRRLIN